MKKLIVVILLAVGCVSAASLWESVFTRRSEGQRVESFEKRLHQEERWADEMLKELTGTEEPHWTSWKWKYKKFTLLGFRQQQLLYWNNERVGVPNLYRALREGGNFVKLNNSYYDVRERAVGDVEYFALIFLQDDYPHANRYLKNTANDKLGANLVEILAGDDEPGGTLVRDRDGRELCRASGEAGNDERAPNPVVLLLYLLALCLFFYAYKLALVAAPTLRVQLSCLAVFVGVFALARWVMYYFKVPYSLYHLDIYQTSVTHWNLALPVGELFITIFCVVNFLFISFQHVRLRFEERRLTRCKYCFMVAFLLFAFAYVNVITYAIESLIENTRISLNVARIMNVDLSSIMAFVTLVIGATGLLVLIGGSVRYFSRLFTLRQALAGAGATWGCLAVTCAVVELPVTWGGCLFALGLYALQIVNEYAVKGELQRTLSIVSIVLVLTYVMGLSQANEMQREWAVRAAYASEIIRERDASFEDKLLEVDQKVLLSRVLDSIVHYREQPEVSAYLLEKSTDLTGYHYAGSVIVSRGKASPGEPREEDRWDALIDSLGVRVASTSFYNIDDFNGFTTYIGRFDFPSPGDTVRLYFRFDSKMESDRAGYQQILSREPAHPVSIMYPYSYAKYKDGQLLHSHGTYNYGRTLPRNDRGQAHVEAVDKDNYTHMVVPVGSSGVFIISLGKGFFAPYGLNLLYAILVSLIFSSYGLYRSSGKKERGRESTLKKRIRNNILALICGLMVITTFLSILIISTGFERRQSLEVIRLSRVVSRELERVESVEASESPGITRLLEQMATALQVDVNIYSAGGELVATSLPTIFEKGLDGTLLNPEAYRRITRERASSFVQEEEIGGLTYMAAYMPLELEDGRRYVLSIPYFSKSDELNRDILFLVVISINVAIVVIILAILLSGVVAGRVVQPLQLVNEKLRLMLLDGKNEKIIYNKQDEVGALVKEYNGMVDKLEESVKRLARVEREAAWQEMARQIAHEIKNPLTPMKLNIQFLRRALQGEDVAEARRRFEGISSVLIEQIDHMASIANAFADFAKVSVANNEWFDLSEMVERCVRLFANNVEWMSTGIEPGVFLFGDKEQVNRVLVNLLKNAEQSIPEGRQGEIAITLERGNGQVLLTIKDNGAGIPVHLQDRVAEPNFTTKSSGMGLGLPISYKIVEGMGGTIRFESEPDAGTTFFVTFREARMER
jgi:signal transduction histidine kinase